MERGDFSYWGYIVKRCVRLWPLVLLMGGISLSLGYFLMLPDDYENLSESVIASNLFANNVLACITTRNYWDIVNTYKPLMHTWYLGVLMQMYIVLPLIIIISNKLSHNNRNVLKNLLIIITLASVAAYILPLATAAAKFYYLPYRAFEMTAGGLIAFIPQQRVKKFFALEVICLLILIGMLCIHSNILHSSVKLIITCCATVYLLFIFQNTEDHFPSIASILALLGKCSFSIYLCHQVVVAFMYYNVTNKINIVTFVVFAFIVILFSALCYNFVEKPIGIIAKDKKKEGIIFVSCLAICLVLSGISGYIYSKAGVVRDIPEFGITTTNVHRGMHKNYSDRPYKWDVDFTDSEKTKIIVIGNSFGRDWANVLAESGIADQLEISYIYPHSYEYIMERENRIQKADYVFYVLGPGYHDIPEYVQKCIPSMEKLYVVGNKNYGESNGIIYSRRNRSNYFELAVKVPDDLLKQNEQMKQKYGDNFVDLLSYVEKGNGYVRIFTPEHKFISQDCRHLTQYGAQYYAKALDQLWKR